MPPLPPDLLFLEPSPPKLSSSVVSDVVMNEVIHSSQVKLSSATEVLPGFTNSLREPDNPSSTIKENLKTGEPLSSFSSFLSVFFGTVPEVINSKDNSQSSAVPIFSWTERSKKARKFPKSSVHVTLTKEGVPRIKVPNVVFERGAKLHSNYIEFSMGMRHPMVKSGEF